MIGVAGCSADARKSSGTPPVKICGSVIHSGAQGSVMYEIHPGARAVTEREPYSSLANEAVLVKLTDNCERGVTYSIRPSGLLAVTRSVHDADGATIAIALSVKGAGKSEIVVRSSSGTVGHLTIDLYK